MSEQDATTDRRVLFFGDSFVAGVFDPNGLGWVGRVVAATFAAGVALTPYNLGVRRETSEQIAGRWLAEARPRLAADADCRVVFSFGANDTTVECGRPRVELERSIRALAFALAGVRSIGLAAFVVGPPPVGTADQDERIVALSARFAELAGGLGVPYVPVVEALLADEAWTAEAAANDGVHPGARGYEALAGLVLDGGWPDWVGATDGSR